MKLHFEEYLVFECKELCFGNTHNLKEPIIAEATQIRFVITNDNFVLKMNLSVTNTIKTAIYE